MREIIQELNKHSLSSATDISYSRLRKYAAGTVSDLTPEECQKIYNYLIEIAQIFKVEKNHD